MYGFSLVLQQQLKPVIARAGSAPEEYIRKSVCHILKASLRSVDHLHRCCPCLVYRASNDSSIHPLRGASLRSAPRSSRHERIAFPICRPCLARLYLARAQGSYKDAEEQIPRSPGEAYTLHVPRESQEKIQEGLQRGPRRPSRMAPERPRRSSPEGSPEALLWDP